MKNLRFTVSLFTAGLFFTSGIYGQSPLRDNEVLDQARQNIEEYRKGDVSVTVTDAEGKPLKGAAVEINQQRHDFLFGALLFDLARDNPDPDRSAKMKEQFLTLFNYGILPFYWKGYEYKPGHPRYDRMTETLKWCLENGITPKGHPLAWTHPAGTPDWIFELSPEDAWLMQESRIIENVLGFDEIQLWDVVNEPVNTIPWPAIFKDLEGERRYTTQIPIKDVADWVDVAYRAAHRANPEKQLVLNEFKQIADEAMRDRFYSLVETLLERGTPIHGLGIQAHEPREDWYDPKDVWETFELYTSFGLPIHITEFSPQSKGAAITGGYKTGTWTEETQAEFAEMMFTLSFGHPSVASINWWGFSDANAWLPGCGIFDDELNPKPVYYTLDRLINDEWKTKGLMLKSDRKGKASFRGFYGTYSVKVIVDGNTKTCTRVLKKDQSNHWEISLDP